MVPRVPRAPGVKRRLQERQQKRVAVPSFLARVALSEVSELPQYGQRGGGGGAADDDDGDEDEDGEDGGGDDDDADDGDDDGDGRGGGGGGGGERLAIKKAYQAGVEESRKCKGKEGELEERC